MKEKAFLEGDKKAFNPEHEDFSKKYIVQKRAGFLKHKISVIENGKSHVKSQHSKIEEREKKITQNNIFHKSKVHLILV